MKHVQILFLCTALIPYIITACELGELAQSVPYLSSPQANCTTNGDCTSVKCTGMAEGRQFIVGVVFSVCDVNPSITVLAHVPHLGIKDWSATLEDGNEVSIPGYRFPVNGNQTVPTYIAAGLKKVSNEETFLFNLTVKGCINNHETLPECPMINRTLQNKKISFSCQSKSHIGTGTKCQISVPFTCGNNETCQQIGTGTEGVCVPIAEQLPETPVATSTPATTPTTPSKHETELLAIDITVPLLIAALVIAFIIAAYRKGWIRKWRMRYESRNQFEQFSSTSRTNDDDDEPLPL